MHYGCPVHLQIIVTETHQRILRNLNAFSVVLPAQEIDDIFKARYADDPGGDLIVRTRRKDHLLDVGYKVILFRSAD